MSKASALSLLSGVPAAEIQTQASLLTPDVKTHDKPDLKVTSADPPAAPNVDDKAEPKDELNSSRLAIFAKKEAAIQREREALKKEREDWEKGEKAKAAEIVAKGKQFDETFSKDKLAALKMLGYSDADIINMVTAVEEKKEIPSLPKEEIERIAEEKTKALREELAAEKKQLAQERDERLISNLKSSIKDTIKNKAEKYDYCNFEGEEAESQAYEFIVHELKETKGAHLLTVDEALEMTEEYYEMRDKARLEAVKKRAAANPSAPPAAPSATKDGQIPRSNIPVRPKTLTNNLTATTAATVAPQNESRSEKKERLAKLLLSMTS